MIANAMKKAEVTVYTAILLREKKTKVATVGSLISFEGEREPTTPGYIEVYAFGGIVKKKVQRKKCWCRFKRTSYWYRLFR